MTRITRIYDLINWVWPYILSVMLTTLLFSSCKKKSPQANPVKTRYLKFILSSNGDFSGLQDSIFISMRVEKLRPLAVIWEADLAPMQLRDLPKDSNRFEYTKVLTTADTGLLRFGFRYSIKDVGQFWKYDSIGKNDLIKQIHLDFK